MNWRKTICLLYVKAPPPGHLVTVIFFSRACPCAVEDTYVNTPPSKGPAAEATPHMLLTMPITAGRLCNGAIEVSEKMLLTYRAASSLWAYSMDPESCKKTIPRLTTAEDNRKRTSKQSADAYPSNGSPNYEGVTTRRRCTH